jgi:hypothetical protein
MVIIVADKVAMGLRVPSSGIRWHPMASAGIRWHQHHCSILLLYRAIEPASLALIKGRVWPTILHFDRLIVWIGLLRNLPA